MTNTKTDEGTELSDLAIRPADTEPTKAESSNVATRDWTTSTAGSAASRYAAAPNMEAGNRYGDVIPPTERGETSDSPGYLNTLRNWATDTSIPEEQRNGRQALLSMAGVVVVGVPVVALSSLGYGGPV